MENQHRKISGYRELTQAEIDLINEIKELGRVLEVVCARVDDHIAAQIGRAAHQEAHENDDAERKRIAQADPQKWARWARDGMQANLMYLTRAVAQPTFF